MKIKKFDKLLDGGTVIITTTDDVEYYIDGRISSDTKDKIYLSYPHDNKEYLENSEEILKEIVIALKNYNHSFYQTSIDSLIEKYNKN